MEVNKIITTIKSEELNIVGAILLSAEEAETLLTENDRGYKNWWWLRSPGDDCSFAASINYDGSVDYDGDYVHYDEGCVRPALKISGLKSSNLNIGDRFLFDGKTFKIISEELAFCEGDIGYCWFRKDWESKDANVYEVSDVKKFVDDWFKDIVSRKLKCQI